MILFVLLFGHESQGSSEIFTGLRNAHLKVVGEFWAPFLIWECSPGSWVWEEDCIRPNERTRYAGVMWDLLMFMKKARNLTITMVAMESYNEWGHCYQINNCTGMVGIVNRKEADLAIGKYGNGNIKYNYHEQKLF